MLVFGLSVASSSSEARDTHKFLELDRRDLRLYECLCIPDRGDGLRDCLSNTGYWADVLGQRILPILKTRSLELVV